MFAFDRIRRRIGCLCVLCGVFLGTAEAFGADPIASEPADLIVRAGRIWTGDPHHPWAEAIAARKGMIVAVGSADEVSKLKGPATRVIERPTAFAMPGLIDAHGHISSLGSSLEEIDLRGVSSLAEVARRVKERIEENPENTLVIGRNWDQSLWPGEKFPTAAVLDSVSSGHPVWMTRVDGHAGWANTEAMRRAGINASTKAPSDGQILRDESGKPTGVFIDGAMGLVAGIIPPQVESFLKPQILKAQEVILRNGLTCVHDAGLSRLEIEAFRELDREGKLAIRVYGMASPPSGKEIEYVSNPPDKPKAGAHFELRAIKLFIDGAMGSRGALLFEPYDDDPMNSGLRLIDPRVLTVTTTTALRNGWQVATHAIGDKANALVLDAYAKALKAVPEARDPRLRIEHAQVVRKSDVGRFAALGVIASMQPSHASDDMRWAEARVGPDRVNGAYAWRWFLDAKVPMAFGSDFPVEIVNPFWGIYAALTRRDANDQPSGGWHPEHRLTVEETLRAFTAGAAYAGFAEERLGKLAPGFRADLTLVDRDPFRLTPREVLDSKVIMTIIDGKIVHDRH
jgi:predicted amidohydrolase YtcJ